MFKNDLLTVKRENYTVTDNLAVKKFETVYEDIPCHLSVNLNNVAYIQNTPFINSEFMVYLNFDEKIQIKENDELTITTSKGEHYKLYAGAIKIYNFSIQIKCKQEKIIESSFNVNQWN